MRFLVKTRYSFWDVFAVGVGTWFISLEPGSAPWILFMVFIGMFIGALLKDMIGE